ncbi:hypothetical protein ACFQE1_19670, partial [Halobium palmae]
MSVTSAGESILLTVDGRERELSRADAAELQEALGAALTEKREFFRTAGEYREDGSYVVSRRGADSSGNAKVFDSFDALRRLYERLPEAFTAEDVGRSGITGSRRHMVVRHFGEHPAFDCGIGRRNPLTVEKAESEATSEPEPEATSASGSPSTSASTATGSAVNGDA